VRRAPGGGAEFRFIVPAGAAAAYRRNAPRRPHGYA
jgi:hypothetical protein